MKDIEYEKSGAVMAAGGKGRTYREVRIFLVTTVLLLFLTIPRTAFGYERDYIQGFAFFQQQNLENRQSSWSDKTMAVDAIFDYADSGNLKIPPQ